MKNNLLVNKRKTIGIIGGVGPQATKFIYGRIIRFAQEKYHAKNNDDYPHMIISSLPIPDFINDTKNLLMSKKMLIQEVKHLSGVGATKIAIGSNTVHILLEELLEITGVEFISVIEEVGKRCSKLGFNKVALLGSPVLLHSGLYQKELAKYKIEVQLPNDRQLKVVEEIIRDVLAGRKDGDKKKVYIRMLSEFFSNGAEGIILGCTELPLAINYEALGARMINSDEVLAEAITNYYYQ